MNKENLSKKIEEKKWKSRRRKEEVVANHI